MSHVEIAIPALESDNEVRRAVVNAMRPSVRSQGGQSLTQSSLELKLCRVVIRCEAVFQECKQKSSARRKIYVSLQQS